MCGVRVGAGEEGRERKTRALGRRVVEEEGRRWGGRGGWGGGCGSEVCEEREMVEVEAWGGKVGVALGGVVKEELTEANETSDRGEGGVEGVMVWGV